MRENLKTVLLFRNNDTSSDECIDRATIADTPESPVRTWKYVKWWPHYEEFAVAKEHWGL